MPCANRRVLMETREHTRADAECGSNPRASKVSAAPRGLPAAGSCASARRTNQAVPNTKKRHAPLTKDGTMMTGC